MRIFNRTSVFPYWFDLSPAYIRLLFVSTSNALFKRCRFPSCIALATWHGTCDLMLASWPGTCDVMLASWHGTYDVLLAAWHGACHVLLAAWHGTCDVLLAAWHGTCDVMLAGWHGTCNVMLASWHATRDVKLASWHGTCDEVLVTRLISWWSVLTVEETHNVLLADHALIHNTIECEVPGAFRPEITNTTADLVRRPT